MRYEKWLLRFIPLFLIILGVTVCYSSEIDDLNKAIKAKGGKWIAKENPLSLLSHEEKKMRAGTVEVGTPPDRSLAQPLDGGAPTAAPPTYDWRNVSGSKYVTPVRNQGNCGSCWAFAVTAALESKALITFNTPGTDLNLSEQIVVSCSGAGSCSGGSPSTASNFLVSQGTNLESCYPYTATNGSCSSACPNWQNGAYRINSWSYVSSGSSPTADTLKNAIYTNGPIVAVFDVYNDFYSYSSGVYSYTSGSYVGGHAVLIVGWDDAANAFIVKNSWGTGWGESGYFRIAYSELTGTSRFARSSYAYGNVYQAIVEFIPPETTIVSGPGGAVSTNDATLTFIFTGSDNVTPVATLVYATYLQGYDTGWSSFSSSTTRSYNNLPPGSYTFQVKAMDQSGNIDPTPATRSFTLNYTNGWTSYKINSNASYSYLNGITKVNSWQGNANDGYVDLSLGDFDFKFYGVSVQEVRVSTNGYITFGKEGTQYLNGPIPGVGTPNAIIAPFWDDLDLSGLGGSRGFRWGFVGTAPNRQLVLEWRQVQSHDSLSETYSFEIILYESTNRIKFQYSDVDSGTAHDRGALATVGIENFNGTIGQQFSFNSPSLSNGLAIEFIPIKRSQMVDFDGDGKADISVYRANEGYWYIVPSGGSPPYGFQWGGDSSDVPVPGDFDGDGKTDYAVYRASGGNWYIVPSGGGSSYGFQWGGNVTDIPVPGDYDGDGKTDYGVWRSSEGTWYILGSQDGFKAKQWGTSGDVPVPGDYDGDGKTDYAVWRPSNGMWYILGSRDGFMAQQWGTSGDVPVPGDYEGDGKTDIAVWRPSNGMWYILGSRDGFMAQQWGMSGDIPVPGDYDGDGKTDCTVWRENNGYWIILQSSNQEVDWQQWGMGALNDNPLNTNPASYLYQTGVLYP